MASEPKKLGKYDIVGKIGKGAMGDVYKGHDKALDRFVAIKTIAETLDTDADLIERFRREARNAAQLNHPNIITIYDFVEEEGTIYMVMELLEGQDLKGLIKSGAPLTMDQILSIMEQATDGLGFAHSKGIVHRDLKPANIHISKNGQVKILDFGLVKEASSDMTKTGQIMGTPNYMSPEQVQGLKVDPRSDIFSLGAVFYELLTRKKPFSADSIHATMFKVVQGDREPLSKYTQLPAPLVEAVDRALDANPDNRYSDGAAFRQYFRTIRTRVLAGGDVDSTMTSMAESTVLTPEDEPASAPGVPSTPSVSQRSVPSRTGLGPSASGSRGTLRRRDVTSVSAPSMGATIAPSRPTGLYAAVVLLLVVAGAGFFYWTQSSGQSVDELSQALINSQQELMVRSFEGQDYAAALSQAEELLEADPENAEALRVQREAREALDAIEADVAAAREALDRGATAEAADALSRVLAVDPGHPIASELSGQLNEHFQSQAERARADMEGARTAASSASSRPEFAQAERLRQEASDSFNQGEYTSAAQGYLEAQSLYQQSRAAQQRAEAERRAQAERRSAAQTEEQARLQSEMRGAESAWTRLRQSATEPGVSQQPSYQRAMAEEGAARQLASQGDYEGATRAFQTATSYLERARQELRESQARQAREERARRAAESTPAPTTAPVTSSAPAVAQDEASIRRVLASYERALETKSLDLFRQVKPNLSADEAKRLQASFEAMDSHEVELGIDSIAIDGSVAEVNVTRRDVIVVRGREQNGNTRQQVFVLTKAGERWVIEQIR